MLQFELVVREADLNPGPPDYESAPLTTRPHCLLMLAHRSVSFILAAFSPTSGICNGLKESIPRWTRHIANVSQQGDEVFFCSLYGI